MNTIIKLFLFLTFSSISFGHAKTLANFNDTLSNVSCVEQVMQATNLNTGMKLREYAVKVKARYSTRDCVNQLLRAVPGLEINPYSYNNNSKIIRGLFEPDHFSGGGNQDVAEVKKFADKSIQKLDRIDYAHSTYRNSLRIARLSLATDLNMASFYLRKYHNAKTRKEIREATRDLDRHIRSLRSSYERYFEDFKTAHRKIDSYSAKCAFDKLQVYIDEINFLLTSN